VCVCVCVCVGGRWPKLINKVKLNKQAKNNSSKTCALSKFQNMKG